MDNRSATMNLQLRTVCLSFGTCAVVASLVLATGCVVSADGEEGEDSLGVAAQSALPGQLDFVLYNNDFGMPNSVAEIVNLPVGEGDPGSGFLISRDLFLTHNHSGTYWQPGEEVEFKYQLATVNPPTMVPQNEREISKVVEVVQVHRVEHEWDYAVVRLENSPGDRWGWMNVSAIDPSSNQEIVVIGYPGDWDLQALQLAGTWPYNSTVKKITAGNYTHLDTYPNWFDFDAPVYPANSGSPAFSTSGLVIGLVTGQIGGDGQAMRMTRIVADSPTVRKHTRGDIPLVGDFDGDGNDEIAAYWQNYYAWPYGSGVFRWREVNGGATTTVSSGLSNVTWEVPLVGNVDGLGGDDLILFNRWTGAWSAYAGASGTPLYVNQTPQGFSSGGFGYVALVGNVDGSGGDDLVLYNSHTGEFQARGGMSMSLLGTWNSQAPLGSIPFVGDLDGDGDAEVGYYDPAGRDWRAVDFATKATVFSLDNWGSVQDQPVVADFDGDGDDDVSLYRPSSGYWYFRNGFSAVQYGTVGDIPLAGDFANLGRDQVVVWRPTNAKWFAKDAKYDTAITLTSPYFGTSR